MQWEVLKEAGYEESALGFSKSYNSTPARAKELFPTFAFKGGGETKFLESIVLWLWIEAPRYWWQEADTYRISTKQSGSTMHTLAKRPLTMFDFEAPIDPSYLDYLNRLREQFNRKEVTIDVFKNALPEGFLQERVWMMSYKTLQNIVAQRSQHRLPQWRWFCSGIVKLVEHPEFLVRPQEGD